MNRTEVCKVLQESFLGAFPESALRKLEDGARVTTLSARQLLYDPEISIIGEGTVFLLPYGGFHLQPVDLGFLWWR
jgi:hypothetical protein